MRILVVGGNGFIGSHVADRLLALGHPLRVLDKQPELYRAPLAGVEQVIGDFGNRGLLAEAVADVDAVVHLGWTTLPRSSDEDPAFDVVSNVAGSLALMDACVAAGAHRLVFLSSGGTVYGEPGHTPVDEAAPLRPKCSYGVTKLAVEHYLRLYASRGLSPVVLRPSNPYGPRQNPYVQQGVLGTLVRCALSGRTFELWGTPDIVRDYLYVADLADAVARAVETPRAAGVYNIGSGEGRTIAELIEAVEHATGCRLHIARHAARALDVSRIVLDCTAAARELGWHAATPFADGLARTVAFQRQLGETLPPPR